MSSLLPNAAQVLRRVPTYDPEMWRAEDGSISSKAFSLRKGEQGLSVDIEGVRPLLESIKDPKRFQLFRLGVAPIREMGLECLADPNPPEEPENSAHALIVGVDGRISKSAARKLAALATQSPVVL